MLDEDVVAHKNFDLRKAGSSQLSLWSSGIPRHRRLIKLCLLLVSILLLRNVMFAESLPPISATISFSPTNAGRIINPAFCGLSYGKFMFTNNLFTATNTPLLNMFSQISPGLLRIGGNSTDKTCWGGLSNLPAVTASQIDAFAGFVHALPRNWHVLYGINMSVNVPTNATAEASYVANALGSRLLGFEIGNECDLYHLNGIRPTNYDYAQFLVQWQALASAITNAVPGWARTNSGIGWALTGPVDYLDSGDYALPFAQDEPRVISMLTTHYYLADGLSSKSTMALLLQSDTNLPRAVSNLAAAAEAARLPLGYRCDECGSYANGGSPKISDAYGSALWAVDFMFTQALNGSQGVNFNGGEDDLLYSPIGYNESNVLQARPELYGIKLFSLLPQGSAIPALISLDTNINFTAYGVRQADGGISAVLNNKETNISVKATINLGPNVTAATVLELTGPALNSTNGYTIGGAQINADGSWIASPQSIIIATNNQFALTLPTITAILLRPLQIPQLTFSRQEQNGGRFVLSWTNAGFSVQAATDPCGPFTNVTDASPYVVTTTNSHSFYRLRVN